MMVIEFFAGSQSLSNIFRYQGHNVTSLDFVQVKGSPELDLKMDFMDFDYKSYSPGHFDILYFGQPCTCFSKASGGLHFSKIWEPRSHAAKASILMLERTFEIINYFKNATFYIENPAGRLYDFPAMQVFVKLNKILVYRLDLGAFGFATKKQTDIFTNSKIPFLFNPVHRVNGKYQIQKFDNLSKVNRQKYPIAFCEMIVANAVLN